jgi:hypothetical protein
VGLILCGSNAGGNMSFIEHLIFTCGICAVWAFLFKWVLFLPVAFLTALIKNGFLWIISRVFGFFVITSIIALATQYELIFMKSTFWKVFYGVVGFILVYFSIGGSIYIARRNANTSNDQQIIKWLSYDSIWMISAFIFYPISFIFPSLLQNPITTNAYIWAICIRSYVYDLVLS